MSESNEADPFYASIPVFDSQDATGTTTATTGTAIATTKIGTMIEVGHPILQRFAR
jgi:hypothetical protein